MTITKYTLSPIRKVDARLLRGLPLGDAEGFLGGGGALVRWTALVACRPRGLRVASWSTTYLASIVLGWPSQIWVPSRGHRVRALDGDIAVAGGRYRPACGGRSCPTTLCGFGRLLCDIAAAGPGPVKALKMEACDGWGELGGRGRSTWLTG